MMSVPSNQLPLPSPSLNLFSAGVLLSMVTRIRVARTTVVLWRWAWMKRRSQSNPSVSWRASAKLEQIESCVKIKKEKKVLQHIYMLFIIQGQVFWKVIGAKHGVKVDRGFNFSCTCISAFSALIFFWNLTSESKSNLTVKKYDQQTSQKSYWSIFFHWLSETK